MLGVFEKNKIYHMASMARSGETLMLKIFAVHPQIKVIHNLEKNDNKNSLKAFEYLKTYKHQSISRNHKIIKPYELKKGDKLLIKQGVWRHRYPFKGFVLSRNPISIYSSLKSYDKKQNWYDANENFWQENENRFRRWLKVIEPDKIDGILSKKPVEQFVDFYNLRMGDLLEVDIPVIRYEDLIVNTKVTLETVCNILGVPINEELLNSHKYYKKGLEGHGQNDLSKPIDDSSLSKYKLNVTEAEFNYIKENTSVVHGHYGYKINNGCVEF